MLNGVLAKKIEDAGKLTANEVLEKAVESIIAKKKGKKKNLARLSTGRY